MNPLVLLSIVFSFLSSLSIFPFNDSLASETENIRALPANVIFTASIESPGHMTICSKELWVFSESTQNLMSVNIANGKILKNFPLSYKGKNPIDVAAIACKNDRLYILINAQPSGRILEISTNVEKLTLTNEFLLADNSKRASHLSCNSEKCWLLQDKPFISDNFKSWKSFPVQSPPELKKVNSNPKENPFEDWQATLNLAQGKYTKVILNNSNQVALLDPFHAQVVINNDFSKPNTDWKKWGRFGAWEGSFLAPKAITFLSNKIIAISDTKLKSIFIFDFEGSYLGVLVDKKTNKVLTPDYPIAMTSQNDLIVISDFRNNKIIGLRLPPLETIEKSSSNPINIRHNLFRRDEVLKDKPSSLCLNCHDGTVSNQLYKFIKLKFHHPLECSQCHDPHHVSKKPHFLRDTTQQLCQSCHKEYSDTKTNHIWNHPHKKGGRCTDCHASHTNSPKILLKPLPQLCESCHQNKVFYHKTTEDLAILNKAKNVHLEEGKINCQTCHQTHINWKESRFIKNPSDILPFCSSCHGDKSLNLFREFHKSKKLKSEPIRELKK